MLNETSQRKINILYDTTFTWNLKKKEQASKSNIKESDSQI